MELKSSITTEAIRQEAFRLGWDDVGITQATIPDQDVLAYQRWLSTGNHADLAYMENAVRCEPHQLFPGAKTAILFVSFYKQEKVLFKQGAGLIASYARGRDYHHVHRKRLKKFIHWLETVSRKKGIARGFSDSAPLLEKALAVQAGLGWFGKNTLLIHRKFGTFTLLAGILTSLDIEQSVLETHQLRCGSCTRCLDACPTQALVEPYVLDARKCLSYHLIESKEKIPEEIQERNPGYIFGCDICQDVCPHNSRKSLSLCEEFRPDKGRGVYVEGKDLVDMKNEPEILHGTPLQRKGVRGLSENYESLFSSLHSRNS